MGLMLNRWNRLWRNLGAGEIAKDLYSQLINAYNERHRAYHNIHHIKHCLSEFDQVKDRLRNPQEVELAIWFHDVIYDPKAVDNEEKSAQFAATQLNNAGAACINIDRVKELILDTRHNRPTTILRWSPKIGQCVKL